MDNVTGAEVGDFEALVRLFEEVISLALLLVVGFQQSRFSFWTVPSLSVQIREFSNNVS